ncbi:hypothetical protein [Castellaniella sp.]|uniref:hypothetical protein n=1 Tax=Castellaniella sp. TaxID=1955812 RepID=UPI002AFE0D42|nr:hypothetical protein [Castellaniella sp.]
MDRVPDFNKLPAYVGRIGGAEIVTQYYFPVSYRSLERWPIKTRRVNGRVVMSTRELLAEARRRFDAAPVIMANAATSSENDEVME